MPPKQKITKEEILKAAYELVLQEGYANLSSRNVAHAVGCSVQPIFSHFPTMESLKQETYRYACRQCAGEVLNDQSGKDILTVMTLWMLDLATNRPNLFELLYLSDMEALKPLPQEIMHSQNHKKMLEVIRATYHLEEDDSEDLLVRCCIFLMGIGTMICISKMDIPQRDVLRLMENTVTDFVDGVRRKNASES